MIGQTVSHYEILEKLGKGGMGVVYKAEDTRLGRTVALKFLLEQMTADEAEKERFIHEARAASSLNHPNVTTIYEIDEYQGRLFISMEYCPGESLKDLIERRKLKLKEVLDIAIQICGGLTAAHKKDVVHRAIELLEGIIDRYPDEKFAHTYLGIIYSNQIGMFSCLFSTSPNLPVS